METNDALRRPDVLVVGAYFADLVFHGLTDALRPGGEVFAEGFALVPGGAYSPAMALRRLGRDVVWSTDFGTDAFSAQVLAAARHEGLDEAAFRHHPFPVRSLTVALAADGERSMVSFQDPVAPEQLALLLRRHRPRFLVLPQLRCDDAVLGALRVARELGTVVVMDCHDTAAALSDPAVRRTLAEVDVFTPNAAEAVRLTGAGDVEDAVTELAALVPVLVVKRGANGATAVQGGKRHDVPAVPSRVVDTTGAGDCFNAGFVHGLLAGWSLPDCLTAAVVCGAAATTGPGSSAALRADDLDRRLGRSTELPGTLPMSDQPSY
ncbi:carbohydrate kinase family protein [Kitasatospora acidiphila]|uniref:carbohydrate kinase family protein n=1 Tax=Kitasatospora acidiphila TaxID=2567942 RepID=UPI003C7561E5